MEPKYGTKVEPEPQPRRAATHFAPAPRAMLAATPVQPLLVHMLHDLLTSFRRGGGCMVSRDSPAGTLVEMPAGSGPTRFTGFGSKLSADLTPRLIGELRRHAGSKSHGAGNTNRVLTGRPAVGLMRQRLLPATTPLPRSTAARASPVVRPRSFRNACRAGAGSSTC